MFQVTIMSTLCILVLCMVTLCSAGAGFRVELDNMWESFKQTHGKRYESTLEEDYR